MAQRLTDWCNILSIQGFTHGEHWTTTIPYGPDAFVDPLVASEDMIDHIENTLIPAFQLTMGQDNEILGYAAEGMTAGGILPLHVNFPAGTFPGSVVSDSAPANVSMLGIFHSTAQASSGARVRTAKNFLGPPPLSKVVGQTLDGTFVATPLRDLVVAIRGPVTGFSSGIVWRRMLSRNHNSGVMIYVADQGDARGTVFTQRRRLVPIF